MRGNNEIHFDKRNKGKASICQVAHKDTKERQKAVH